MSKSFEMAVHVMKLVDKDGQEDDVKMSISSVEFDESGLWIYVIDPNER